MTTLLRFESSSTLQSFIRDRALAWSDWRGMPIWRNPAAGSFTIGVPTAANVVAFVGAERVESPPTGPQVVASTLGDLWRCARPVLRDRSAADTPCAWLFILTGLEIDSCDRFIDVAPSGLEMLELQESASQGRSYFACILRGEAARILAQSPPVGCEAFECDETPGGGLAALPAGWRAPRMLDELWPQGRDRIAVYRQESHGEFTMQELREAKRYPLAHLLTKELKAGKSLADPTRRLRKSRWRVVHRASIAPEELRDLDNGETTPVVFRVKTFDHSGRAGNLGQLEGHELGNSLLQVLDECEAGLLPTIRYSAIDISEFERWHFLFAKEADNRLLDAWGMLDRFEFVPELAEHGLQVFVSVASRMIPPIPAMLNASATRREILDRISNLLGRPEKGSIVLIEDLETAGADSQAVWETRSVNPRIVHVDLATSSPLSELIPKIVRDWHNAEPMRARADSAQPGYISELREGHESRLRSIAAEEEEVLRDAAATAQRSLESWAMRAKEAIDKASVPVREAQAVCVELEGSLAAGAASFDQACAQLLRFCTALTTPRRSWIPDQLRLTATALSEAAPRIEEAAQVRNQSEGMRRQLDERAATLTRAIDALQAIAPQLQASQSAAAATLQSSTAAREQVETLAASALRQVQSQMSDVVRELGVATARRQEVRDRRAQLEAERARVAEMERENNRLNDENRALETENRRRTASAQSQRQEVERLRDVEIPRLRQEALNAEQQLAALNPASVQAQYRAVSAELESLRAQIRAVDAQIAETAKLRAGIVAETTGMAQRRSELGTERDEYERERVALGEALQALERAIAEFKQQREAEGDAKWVRDRVADAQAALEKLRAPKPKSIWNPFGFGRT